MNYKNTDAAATSRELMINIHRLTMQLSKMQFSDGYSTGTPEELTEADKFSNKKQWYHELYNSIAFSQTSDSSKVNAIERLLENGLLTKENVHEALRIKTESLLSMIDGLRRLEGEEFPGVIVPV